MYVEESNIYWVPYIRPRSKLGIFMYSVSSSILHSDPRAQGISMIKQFKLSEVRNAAKG